MNTKNAMEAIPTKHNGLQFRSRLEATWAAFFDLLGWRYEYEPPLCDGWIPDFMLIGTENVLVEIKPYTWNDARWGSEVLPKIWKAAWDREEDFLLLGIAPCLGKCATQGESAIGISLQRGIFENDKGKSQEVPSYSYMVPACFVKYVDSYGYDGKITKISPELEGAWGFHDSVYSFHDPIHGYSFGNREFWDWPEEEEVLQIWKQAKNVTQWRAR